MNIKVSNKSSELSSILYTHFGQKMNLARIKFFGMFICALCKVQTVGFEKLAGAFDSDADRTSSLRRIQRFMADYLLDTDLIARFIFSLLPHSGPYILSMDRTNWKFGDSNINALVLAVVYDGVAFPILYSLLDKRGNSNTSERIGIIDRYIRLFGKSTIMRLVADREFVGEHWLDYLNMEGIHYHIRIRDNFWVENPRTGQYAKASWFFAGLRHNECRVLHKIYRVNGQLCYLSASKLKNKEGKPELQVLVSFNKPEQAQLAYKDRWQIETAFRGLKSSGFNIEDTHLTQIDRIEKLFALVIVAFAWAYLTGIYLHNNVKPIRMLKHGRRAYSFFKYGLNYIANVLLNNMIQNNIDIFKILSCT